MVTGTFIVTANTIPRHPNVYVRILRVSICYVLGGVLSDMISTPSWSGHDRRLLIVRSGPVIKRFGLFIWTYLI